MYAAFSAGHDHPVQVLLYTKQETEAALKELPEALGHYARQQGFAGRTGQLLTVPNTNGALTYVLGGLGEAASPLTMAAISAALVEGDYEIVRKPAGLPFAWLAAGWADGAYRFDRYLSKKTAPPRLIIPDGEDGAAISREAEAVSLVRDLVNTPPGDMGPDAIEAAVRVLGVRYGASVTSIVGEALLDENYPMIHAVGRASDVPPRLVMLEWGKPGDPELALVGKGVSFDTGGLNLKPGGNMRNMKKDMGGAAHTIALAGLVMDAGLPVRLKLYVPAVENSVAGNAFRPGDIIASRKGLSVEIDNTDAEGRLILGDTLTRACESEPDLLIDFATLTGAARVALGPDIAPFYTDDEALAAGVAGGGAASGDPVWRMPLWNPYLQYLASPVADIVNSGSSFAGSITAALFLKRFVDTKHWVHLDVWAWREAKYGRPQGAAACGLRAVWAMLEKRYTS